MVAGCCFKMLENPAVAQDKDTREVIFYLLGLVVKTYNQGVGEGTIVHCMCTCVVVKSIDCGVHVYFGVLGCHCTTVCLSVCLYLRCEFEGCAVVATL